MYFEMLNLIFDWSQFHSPDLLYRVASATGAEVRGKHNDFVKQGNYGEHTGASCFSPVINIARDPRWGRIQVDFINYVF